MYTVRISVRDLVAFALQTGDIDTGFVAGGRQMEGIWHHQAIQRDCKAGSTTANRYTSEVVVTQAVTKGGIKLEVGGRIDGIFENSRSITIQEIKTTSEPLESLTAGSHPLHWAQAECYASMYARKHKKKSVAVRLVYSHLDSRDTKTFEKEYTHTELDQFFKRVTGIYIAWAKVLQKWSAVRDASIEPLAFPFETYRAGQEDLIEAAEQTIKNGDLLFAQAPTGIGKTMATLYPAVKAVGKGTISKIFYATAKTVTRVVAANSLDTLRRGGLRLKTVTITAKDKICFNPDAECTPEECKYAKGYYDRLKPAMEELFEGDVFDRPAIEACAKKHSLCPFEFSLDMSLWSDCIICDYNYLFDPRVYLRRFFAEEERTDNKEYLFLVDEAHNLVDRAREMFSAQLSSGVMREVQKAAVIPKGPREASRILKLKAALDGLIIFMDRARVNCERGGDEEFPTPGFMVKRDAPEEVLPEVKALIGAAEKVLELGTFGAEEKLLELYFEAHNFLRTADYFDKRYRCYYEQAGEQVTVKLFCVDPSEMLRIALERAASAVFFSATLTPLPYFQRLLGGGDEGGRMKLGSPFPSENLLVMLDDRISTTFRTREHSYDRIAHAIAAVAGGKVGNYIAYFPSYKYMNEVHCRFISANPGIKVVCQRQGMPEQQRSRFLEEFSKFGESTLVGFAVMGGIFGEGIDLVGERLSGVVIVGVGLPQLSLERNIIRQYFQDTLEAGYEYAYVFPGMNKVLQAAGRVIRTGTDRGVILLMDERFAHPPYSELIPEYWHPLRHLKAGGTAHAKELLAEFWK
jgi:DNA excision repair protein ERCC-2